MWQLKIPFMCIFNHMILLMSYVIFFFLRILSIFDTHGEKGEGLKEIDSSVYPKRSELCDLFIYIYIYIYSLINHLVMS